MMWWLTIGLVILAYLLGSFPTAYLVGRSQQRDIRKVGSGTSGAANVWENISHRWGMVVAITDAAKGFLAVFIARLVGAEPDAQWGAGLAVIAGHNWSVFIKFSGGRGLATAGGVLLLLAPLQLAIILAVGTLITLLSSTPLGALLAIRPRRATPYRLTILSGTTLGALAAMSSLPLASLGVGKEYSGYLGFPGYLPAPGVQETDTWTWHDLLFQEQQTGLSLSPVSGQGYKR